MNFAIASGIDDTCAWQDATGVSGSPAGAAGSKFPQERSAMSILAGRGVGLGPVSRPQSRSSRWWTWLVVSEQVRFSLSLARSNSSSTKSNAATRFTHERYTATPASLSTSQLSAYCTITKTDTTCCSRRRLSSRGPVALKIAPSLALVVLASATASVPTFPKFVLRSQAGSGRAGPE